MSSSHGLPEQALPATTPDGAARAQALAEAAGSDVTPTSLVTYTSGGRLLVVGAASAARAAAGRLTGSGLSITLLLADGEAAAEGGAGVPREIRAPLAALRGHLGAFEVDVEVDAEVRPLAPSVLTGHQPFDLVLDLLPVPALSVPVPPPGYYPVGDDARALEMAIEALPDMQGEFEKPRYFDYDPNICAHGARGIRGCTRCIDACPTAAIISIGERVQVDSHLCQGGGSCATVCPTGAITYAYPSAADQIDGLRVLLRVFRDAGGDRPVLLFHDAEGGQAWLDANAAALPERVLPVLVEEIGSVGMDTWLSGVAFGAASVTLLLPATTPDPVRDALAFQGRVANTLLEGLALSDPARPRIRLLPEDRALADLSDPDAGLPAVEPAAFAGVSGKREQLELALRHLYAQAAARPETVALPDGAPFGRIEVDREACTLCFACASVCPASAVLAGGDRPVLQFVEVNCVQCGLCESACPEDAIALESRMLFDPQARSARRVVMEDAPFPCVRCGTVFGTRRTIDRMLEKLAGHWMYQDKPEQLARLQMCEDCRVKDMFRDGGGLLDPNPPAH